MPDTAERTSVDPSPTSARTPASVGDRPAFRLALFGAVLVVVLSVGFGIGRLTGGVGSSGTGAGSTDRGAMADHTHAPGTAPHDHAADGATAMAGGGVGGLAVSSAGLTLVAGSTTFAAGSPQPFRYRIVDPGGRPVTGFAVVHDKPMHLIVVRRDLAGYRHLHPTMAPDGTWGVDLRLGGGGSWRAFADFTVAGADGRQTPVTLGVDLTVAGDFTARPLQVASRAAAVAGYTVTYDGTPRVGATQPLVFRVKSGAAPAALEPYLGAFGHLVVLREGDLGYVHVHPEPKLVDGAVKFWLAVPSAGRYRMFLDVKVAGKVHTAGFTLAVR